MKILLNDKLDLDISQIYNVLQNSNVVIHNNLKSRSTMNFGKVYQYGGVEYIETNYADTPSLIKNIGETALEILKQKYPINMEINNCLVNIYNDGNQKMGFHSDSVEQLADGTGVLIVSVGVTREFLFRDKETKNITDTLLLDNGSIFYMNQECQRQFEHSLPKSECTDMRISLTFRQLK